MSGVDDEKVSRVLDLHDERRRLSHEIRQVIARLDNEPYRAAELRRSLSRCYSLTGRREILRRASAP